MNKISNFLAGMTFGLTTLMAVDNTKNYAKAQNTHVDSPTVPTYETQNTHVTSSDAVVYELSEQPKVKELVLAPKSRHASAEGIERLPYSELLFLKREDDDGKRTLGKLYMDSNHNNVLDHGDEELCYTLERPSRNNQKNVSSIPAGDYSLKRGISSNLGDIFYVQNVPGRTDILIHVGNTVRHTTGCIIVGSTRTGDSVGNSRKTIQSLVKRFGKKEGLGLKISE